MTASEGEFNELRLRGGRYERPGYPVETLAELSRYERLVIDVAKGLWKRENPSRVRLPRGFTDHLQLRLVDIRPGSVVSVLQRDSISESDFTLMAEVEGTFEQARDLIEESILAISHGLELPELMPVDALPSMVRFGSSLREDERIEFGGTRRSVPVVYNQVARRRLAGRTSVERFQEAGSAVGRVTELNPEFRSFIFTTLRGSSLTGKYEDPSLTSDFVSVLNSIANAPIVRVDGILTVTASNDVAMIDDVRSVELFELDNSPWSARFIELLSLRRGWLDGDGAEVGFAALEFAREVLMRCRAAEQSLPGIFPTPPGGVQLEWKDGDQVISIEVSPDLNAELYSLNVATGVENEDEATDPVRAYEFYMGALA